MEKEIILLTKSWKGGGNYCVAGIDSHTGEWVRIISDDNSIQHAVKESDMKLENGSIPEIFDIVNITCKSEQTNYYQPENFIFDESFYWENTGQSSLDAVLLLHPPERHEQLFYDLEKKISVQAVQDIPDCSKYSLVLIKPTNVTIHVTQWENQAYPTVTSSFTYSNHNYRYIKVTDPVFVRKYQAIGPGNYEASGLYFIMSLADVHNGEHYKLIASILGE